MPKKVVINERIIMEKTIMHLDIKTGMWVDEESGKNIWSLPKYVIELLEKIEEEEEKHYYLKEYLSGDINSIFYDKLEELGIEL